MSNLNTKLFWLSVTLASLLAPANVSAQAAGTVIFKSGNPIITHADDSVEQISKNDNVTAGDTIETRDGRLQISYIDGGKVSLQPNTTYKINRYEFSGNEDGSEYAFTELIKGGLRTITGLIGHKNRDRYQLQTPVATIGIRGTEFTVLFDTKLIMTTNFGSVDVCNVGGCQNVVSGQSVSARNSNSKPEFTNEIAKITAAPPSAYKPIYVQAENLNENKINQVVVASVAADSQKTFASSDDDSDFTPITSTSPPQNSVDILMTAVGKESGTLYQLAEVGGTVETNANHNLSTYTSTNTDIKIVSANSNDYFSDAFVTMGRAKGKVNDHNVDTLTYIIGSATNTAGLLQLANLNNSVQYNMLASTAPVISNEEGRTIAVGSPNSVNGSLSVNFAGYTYSFNLNIPIGLLVYNLSGNDSLTAGSADFASKAKVTTNLGNLGCLSGCHGVLTDANGNPATIVGRFIGNQGERAGIQYGTTTGIVNHNTLTGSVVLGKQ